MNKKELERMILNEMIDELYDSEVMTKEMHEAIGELNKKYISAKAKIQEENKQMLEEIVREVSYIEEEQIEEKHNEYLADLKTLINDFTNELIKLTQEQDEEEKGNKPKNKYVTRENGQIIVNLKGFNE